MKIVLKQYSTVDGRALALQGSPSTLLRSIMATKPTSSPGKGGIPTGVSFGIAGASGISAWMFVHPMDVVKVSQSNSRLIIPTSRVRACSPYF